MVQRPVLVRLDEQIISNCDSLTSWAMLSKSTFSCFLYSKNSTSSSPWGSEHKSHSMYVYIFSYLHVGPRDQHSQIKQEEEIETHNYGLETDIRHTYIRSCTRLTSHIRFHTSDFTSTAHIPELELYIPTNTP